MARNDSLSDALSKINNAVKALNRSITLPKTKLLLQVLEVLKKNGYVGSFELIEDGKQGFVKVELLGTINSCSSIKPRYPVSASQIESYETRFLPAKDFGIILISTNKGLLTQKEAKEQHLGGVLVAYCH
ncbi:30S ribosomal protein S8 [Candidatus Woesearchaeota archaeon]|nr:30S ribosomal protein S8 [Nanoarchaeota archaeon]MCB9369978.1 30S ribosomal protein S8 [Candidatus Woesearchaeota archaeon]USN44514.1 MAG: 30S ribosomal protein S8 [Candidatus Woesearchaeota archaeon]